MNERLTPAACLPVDAAAALLVGRAWVPALAAPVPVLARDGQLLDLSALAPTTSALLNGDDPAATLHALRAAPPVATLAAALANADAATRRADLPWLVAPCDLQAIKAAGVTFVASMLERVIEEQARGDPAKAASVRELIVGVIGDDLAAIRPGSAEAMRLKAVLIAQNAWSQYLEVGIGPDAEIFTKAQPMSAVGAGADVGVHPESAWSNPEPEIVLAVGAQGNIVGAALGNDVNLRDFEGRSALLLGKGKDNNASCAIGPFIRLFDAAFTLDDVRRCDLALTVEGPDGFTLQGRSSMAKISRDPADLVAQAIGPHHQYPDGMMLFLGTMFAPTQDRGAPGQGFTHKLGDVVTIATPKLGALVNRVDRTDRVAPWSFGAGALIASLTKRARG